MKIFICVFLFFLLAPVGAFTPPVPKSVTALRAGVKIVQLSVANDEKPQHCLVPSPDDSKVANPLPAMAVALAVFSSTAANAAGPDWGTSFH
jgi:hypothetical protein